MASTYHGWGLQSLVSERYKINRERQEEEKQSGECVVVVSSRCETARQSSCVKRRVEPVRPDYSPPDCSAFISNQASRLLHSKMSFSALRNHHRHRQHLHAQIPIPAVSPSLTKKVWGILCFGVHAYKGRDPREMEEGCSTSRHVTVWTGMQQQERRVCVGRGGGETSVSTFLSPFHPILPFLLSWLAAARERGIR